jgi:hypothetical protein
LYCIVYLSRALVEFDSDEILELANRAADRNRVARITGYLCFTAKQFVQYLEGDEAAIAKLMSVIENDERHKILSVVGSSVIQRRFPEWNMLALDRNDIDSVTDRLIAEFLRFLGMKHHTDKAEYADPLWKMMDVMAQRVRDYS